MFQTVRLSPQKISRSARSLRFENLDQRIVLDGDSTISTLTAQEMAYAQQRSGELKAQYEGIYGANVDRIDPNLGWGMIHHRTGVGLGVNGDFVVGPWTETFPVQVEVEAENLQAAIADLQQQGYEPHFWEDAPGIYVTVLEGVDYDDVSHLLEEAYVSRIGLAQFGSARMVQAAPPSVTDSDAGEFTEPCSPSLVAQRIAKPTLTAVDEVFAKPAALTTVLQVTPTVRSMVEVSRAPVAIFNTSLSTTPAPALATVEAIAPSHAQDKLVGAFAASQFISQQAQQTDSDNPSTHKKTAGGNALLLRTL